MSTLTFLHVHLGKINAVEVHVHLGKFNAVEIQDSRKSLVLCSFSLAIQNFSIHVRF